MRPLFAGIAAPRLRASVETVSATLDAARETAVRARGGKSVLFGRARWLPRVTGRW